MLREGRTGLQIVVEIGRQQRMCLGQRLLTGRWRHVGAHRIHAVQLGIEQALALLREDEVDEQLRGVGMRRAGDNADWRKGQRHALGRVDRDQAGLFGRRAEAAPVIEGRAQQHFPARDGVDHLRAGRHHDRFLRGEFLR